MRASNNPSVVIRLSPKRIREIFNNSQHRAHIKKGTYRAIILSDDPITAEKARVTGWPRGTRSQYVRYLDSNNAIMVEIHRYRKPDGKLAASGKPDPKRVKIGNVMYLSDPQLKD